MKLQPMLVATAIALIPAAALAQGNAGSSAMTDSTRAKTSTNGASNTANCVPGNNTAQQRSSSNSAMNNNSSSNAMGNSANCDRTARGNSSMTNRGSSAYGSSAGPANSNPSTPSPGR